MIDSILLVDDEDLFHLVFEDACTMLDIALAMQAVYSTDEGASLFEKWDKDGGKPECAFIDLNVVGSTFNGIELIRKINEEYGNGIVVGIISSSADPDEIERAKNVGAMFWIVKTDDIEPRLERFHKDYAAFVNKTKGFTVYK